MITDLTNPAYGSMALKDDLEASRRHYQQSWSPATLRAYQADWRDWTAFCTSRGVQPLPAQPLSVAGYLSALAEGTWKKKARLSTIERRRAAIRHMHVEGGHQDPSSDPRVARVLTGIRRQLTVVQARKAALRSVDLRRMVEAMGNDPRSMRDKAVLLLGFATACRRSELAALKVGDLRLHREGLIVEVRRSKSDQEGAGMLKLVRMGRDEKTCAVRALRRWMDVGVIAQGYVFRSITNGLVVTDKPISERGIARVVQRAATAVGLQPELLGAHSLRAGFVTESDARGARASDIMAQSGHRTMRMISIYIRYNLDERFASSTALDLGL